MTRAEQIDYHDDFATALKKINDYEMTRDERAAISILNAYKVGYESGMEDLEQEPCDAISLDAVIEWLKAKDFIKMSWQEENARKELQEYFSVTPSRRKGHWIYRREDKYSCSKCGTTTRVDESGIEEKPMYKFCPNCGAEMESEKE